MKDYFQTIDKYYPADTLRRAIYLKHCRAVADLSLSIARRLSLPLDESVIETAAMLHDIGIFLTSAPDIGCNGSEPYIKHGILGAKLLREEGYPEEIARVAERHTGAGITAEEVIRQGLPLPVADYMPQTLLERLVCYADKFYSKNGDMKRKPLDKVIASMQRISPASTQRFLQLGKEFGE
ncbi:MAG: HD domain-containing protein [Muribaculaceae bacterium]|nr:HD domain-containing protein [Muribaculaceae bacterium]